MTLISITIVKNMQQTQASSLRFPWLALLWFSAAVLALLLIGAWAGTPWWSTLSWLAIPVGIAVVVGVVGGRRADAAGGAYGITSRWARSEAVLSVDASVEQVATAVQRSAEELPRLTLVEISATGACLAARMKMKTWGEHLTLRFRPSGPGRVEIAARCEPDLGITLVDYGQGAADLRQLLESIERQLTGAEQVR